MLVFNRSMVRVFGMMTLEQKIGQLVILGFNGLTEDDDGVREITNLISLGMAGGVIHFRRNIASESQVKQLNAALQDANPRDLPLLISIDQEGGPVVRTNHIEDVSVYPSAKVFAKLSVKKQQEAAERLAFRLKARGFNFNFAPCVDLDLGSPVISGYERSYSDDPETVKNCAKVVCKAHHDAKVIPCLKHYPGHGSARGDTHEDMIDVTQTYSRTEAKVFHDLVAENVSDVIMTAHLFHKEWDVAKPATMARGVLKNLRDHGFDGVIISDDMHMGAIIKKFRKSTKDENPSEYNGYDAVEAAVSALNAGCDMLIYSCNASAAKGVANYSESLGFVPRLIKGIAAEVKSGRVSEESLDAKLGRIDKIRKIVRA